MFATIIILAILTVLLWPAIRTILALRRAQKQAQQAFSQARRAAQEESRRNRPGGWSAGEAGSAPQQQPRRKKIDPSVGEYVEWEEVKVSSTTTDSSGKSTRTTVTEEQITDVEWEEL